MTTKNNEITNVTTYHVQDDERVAIDVRPNIFGWDATIGASAPGTYGDVEEGFGRVTLEDNTEERTTTMYLSIEEMRRMADALNAAADFATK